MDNLFESSFEYKLIYIFEIQDDAHKGLLKIGDATIKTEDSIDSLSPNCKTLNQAAKNRIKQYTNTAGIKPVLLHTELAIRTVKGKDGKPELKAFRDHQVHRVLDNSHIQKKMPQNTTGREWYKVDIETAKKAIEAVKKNQNNLSNVPADNFVPIVFRPEQIEAIEKTLKQFKDANRMLWNAKMRFGKTLSALEVVRRAKFNRTIIITHRPVVDSGWYEDFTKIFHNEENYVYGSKNSGYNVEQLLNSGKKFVYFASMQDLRGSDAVGGKFDKNNAVFSLEWDFVIVDEAHEGTTTALGDDVIKTIVKEGTDHDTKFLALSGTPFNILRDYEDNNIYTWDYVMEQSRKAEWDILHFGDSNPYDELPELRIFTYDLGKLIENGKYSELEDKAFNFREFFRVWTGDIRVDKRDIPAGQNVGDFCHEADVKSFINLITKEDNKSNYPYSTMEYRELFKHSLWMVPGVKEAKALSKMMKAHPVFGCGQFNIVNVAGDGDKDEESKDALQKVRHAIDKAGDGYTITLSCGKLTTGVTVPEWTAVFMLSGSFSTSAANYLQTIFRVQSPCNKDGKIKQCCYVFDFAPDRTLKMVAESVAISTKAGKTGGDDRKILGEFLNYCPVISVDGTEMKKYNTNNLLQQLKRAYAERAVQNGFDDTNLYNDELLKLDGVALDDFADLKKIIGTSKAQQKTNEIDINNQGFTDEEYEELKKIDKKPKRERTPEEQAKLDEAKEKNKNKQTAISILRGISIRMPLLIYGADVDIDEDVTMEKLVTLVDDSSWDEFMPNGVTKEIFKKFIKYYDPEIFIAAGRKIRNTVKSADELPPTERVQKIAQLFTCFKNPDKETVLTPWRVVNMHMSDCLGGYDFYDAEHNVLIEVPRYVDQGRVTTETLGNASAQILEINSKTGLYPLFVAYSIFRSKCSGYSEEQLTDELQEKLWADAVKENVYVICKTPMAKSITKRTLVGFKDLTVNAHYFDDLINMMKNKPKQFTSRVLKPSYWKKEGVKEMKFDAVVGNPPYQENISDTGENASLSKQLFPMFIQNTIKLNADYTSLITPSRWFTADAQDKSFIKLREFIKDNNHFSKIFNYPDNKLLFKGVEIAGGVNYYLFDKNHVGNVVFTECYADEKNVATRPLFEDGLDIIISMNSLVSILDKVRSANGFVSMTTITSGRNAFGIVGKKSELDKISTEEPFDGAIEVRCAYEKIRYTKRENITKSIDVIDKYKIFTSKGNGGAGILTDDKQVAILGKAYIGYPQSVCTDSLIPIGAFDTKNEAENLQKYMSGKFFRFMIGILKVSQNVYQNVYQFVPIQDFTKKSDIDWSKSVSEIDSQLYAKYGLTDEEITYIEEKIKPME